MIPSLILILAVVISAVILPILVLIFYFADIMEYISEMIDENQMDRIAVLSAVLATFYVAAGLFIYHTKFLKHIHTFKILFIDILMFQLLYCTFGSYYFHFTNPSNDQTIKIHQPIPFKCTLNSYERKNISKLS